MWSASPSSRRASHRSAKGNQVNIPGPGQGLWQLIVVKKRSVLSGNANEPGDGDGGPREGSLSCLTVSRKGTASCLAASFTGSKQHVCDVMVPSRVSLHCVHARKHSTMTLESDRPERGSDDRHNAPASGASGALPPSLENVLPGKTLSLIRITDLG